MASTDFKLGEKIHKHLEELGVETPCITLCNTDNNAVRIDQIKRNMAEILNVTGMDLQDDSIQDTPLRVAKMYVNELFSGLDYRNFPKCSVFENKMKYDELVCVRNIQVRSVCEHHLVPFIGTATIAYLPTKNVIGLSKFNRVVDFFSRRPQVQERLTTQIHAALVMVLKTDDVAVVLDAEHFCVKMRGVKDSSSSTVTSKLSGAFREKPELRAEFLALAKQKD